ncbi:MAG: hypothetical protein IIV79_03180 [Clostridia bacterium]|nr:hypothetical protein [Clostridia bacterium]
MKQKFIKSLIVMVLALSVVLCSAISAFALPINNVNNSYFYNVDGWDAAAPLAFTVQEQISVYDLVPGATTATPFTPTDLCYRNGYLYILDSEGNKVFVLDEQYAVVSTIELLSGDVPELAIGSSSDDEEDAGVVPTNRFALNSPQGIYVTNDGTVYISDTENQRIVACDMTGKVSKVYQSIKISVLGSNYSFKPTRLVIDNTGDIQVLCDGINRGIMQITSEGVFSAFFGAPDVIISLWDRIWRNFATEEQLAQMITYDPTEYSSLTVDGRGFIYPTIAALDETSVMQLKQLSLESTYSPVKKLSADGTDMLRRKGLAAPMGDLQWPKDLEYSPKIVDIAVDNESGRYTLLDQKTGRFSTYDTDGNLLYICGGLGTSVGTFEQANALDINGDYVYVADTGVTSKTITVFKATAYVQAINRAAEASSNGFWSESIPLWEEVLSYNSNMYIANIGLGKAEMRLAMNLIDDQKDESGLNALDHYERAIVYFNRANEKDNYSIAYTALRTNEMENYFGLIFGGIAVLIVGYFVLGFVKTYRKKKKEKAQKLAAALARQEAAAAKYKAKGEDK